MKIAGKAFEADEQKPENGVAVGSVLRYYVSKQSRTHGV
jgi:hypothetical protein